MSEARWLDQGGSATKLAFYRVLGPVEAIADNTGRGLVFPSGAIGDFTGGAALLAQAEGVLRGLGVRRARGPLDGNTFFPYRCSLGPTESPPFPTEPVCTPEVWRSAGWREDGRYVSVFAPLSERLCREAPVPSGWTLRTLNMERFEVELASLYRVTCSAFAGAWRYQAVPFGVFAAIYGAMRTTIDPRWVYVLEDSTGEVQGYFLNFVAGDVMICKTLALTSATHGQRLSWPLVSRLHRDARELGLRGAVHALMHETANSLFFAEPGCQVIRRYALYQKSL